MKVGYVLDRFPVLTQTFVQLEIEEVVRQGVDVHVLALRRGADDVLAGVPVTYLREVDAGKRRAVAAHVRAARNPAAYRRFLRAVRRLGDERRDVMPRRLPLLAELVRQLGIDHLHAHFGWSGAAMAWCLSELTGVPWSMTLHGNDLFAQTRNLDAKLAAADRTITVCRYNARYLRDRYGVGADIVVCGVEVPPAPAPPLAEEVDVVVVGRLVPKKGVDLVLDAARSIPHATFEVIGDGPLRADLESAAPPNVRFVGSLPHADVLDRVAHARLLCLPARVAPDGDRDSMPLVVKEAMVRSVAVVVSDEVGLPEVVDETCGWLVPPDVAPALAEALAGALADDGERRRRGAAGRRRIEDGFTLSAEVAKLRAAFGDTARAMAAR